MKSILVTLVCLSFCFPMSGVAGALEKGRVQISRTTFNGIPMEVLRAAMSNRYNDYDPDSYVSIRFSRYRTISLTGKSTKSSGSQFIRGEFTCLIKPSSSLYDLAKSLLFSANSSTEVIVTRYIDDSIAPSDECQSLEIRTDSRLLP